MRKIFVIPIALLAAFARAQTPADQPWPEVTYQFSKQSDPVEEIHGVVVDVTDGKARIRVSRGGPDPDGPGKWQTTLMRTSAVAEREHFDIAVNGDFFLHLNGKDAEGAAALKEFQHGTPAVVEGPAVTDGNQWATPKKPRPCLIVTKSGKLEISSSTDAPKNAAQVIAGNVFMVKDGKALYQTDPPESFKGMRGVNPRTAVGIDRTGTKLYLLVVDGRSEKSKGMSYKQLAQAIADMGAFTAINLDGGGSTTLVMRDPNSSELRVLNHPSDGRERSVGNCLGITFKTQP